MMKECSAVYSNVVCPSLLGCLRGDGPRRAYLARKPMMTTLMIVQVFISNSLEHHIVQINFRTCLQTEQKTESSSVESFSNDGIRQVSHLELQLDYAKESRVAKS